MSDLRDATVYVFVRGDLTEEDQFIQGMHAVSKIMCLITVDYADWKVVALDGGSSQKAIEKTLRKIGQKQVPHTYYEDSDHPEWGVTAIATPPLTKEQSLPLANYRLRRYSPPSVNVAEVVLNDQRGANLNASVAQGQ